MGPHITAVHNVHDVVVEGLGNQRNSIVHMREDAIKSAFEKEMTVTNLEAQEQILSGDALLLNLGGNVEGASSTPGSPSEELVFATSPRHRRGSKSSAPLSPRALAAANEACRDRKPAATARPSERRNMADGAGHSKTADTERRGTE